MSLLAWQSKHISSNPVFDPQYSQYFWPPHTTLSPLCIAYIFRSLYCLNFLYISNNGSTSNQVISTLAMSLFVWVTFYPIKRNPRYYCGLLWHKTTQIDVRTSTQTSTFVYIYLLGDLLQLLLYKVKANNFTFVGSILSKEMYRCMISKCENYSDLRELHKAYTMITDYQHCAVSLLRIRLIF